MDTEKTSGSNNYAMYHGVLHAGEGWLRVVEIDVPDGTESGKWLKALAATSVNRVEVMDGKKLALTFAHSPVHAVNAFRKLFEVDDDDDLEVRRSVRVEGVDYSAFDVRIDDLPLEELGDA